MEVDKTRRSVDLDDGDQSVDSDWDDADDKYRLVSKPTQVKKISERKRQDAAAFAAWLDNNKDIQGNRGQLKSSNSAEAALIGGHWNKKIIASPREYQVELFERAKERNIIVVLDTGEWLKRSGKTLIAALLLKHTLQQELEDRAQGKPKRVAFFIVEKVALCIQQWNVLKCNLEHPVAKFYGDSGGTENTKEYWDIQFDENMVVVCTAAILLNCLNNGFISMRQINLMVFDEAHHAKRNHPFAKIIKHHYRAEPDRARRPRVLGMTASPVDTKTRDMKSAAAELESIMCCEIATVSDKALEESCNYRNLVESKEVFARLRDPEECKTELWEQINAQVRDNPEFKIALEFSLEASSTLGAWCTDRFWKLILTKTEVVRFMAKTHRAMVGNEESTTEEDAKVDAIRRVEDIVTNHTLENAIRQPECLSPKVLSLLEVLEDEFCNRGTQRCIIFVEKRFTAYMLLDLLRQPEMRLPNVVPDVMIGRQNHVVNFANMSFKDQILALRRFKNGDSNCLIATPVAEEGIDIPECDLIIRFDIYNSMIQYIQSKGRARRLNSRYISMVEQDNHREDLRIRQAYQDATILRRFCASLPENRKVQDLIDMGAVIAAEIAGQKVHEIKSTGARLSLDNSMQVLARFISTLNNSEDRDLSPEYVVFPIGKKFAADVVLPEVSPVNYMSGFPQRSKHLAKYSAAFEACMQLLKKGFINEHLQPTFTKKLPAMRNARLAVSSNKKAEYDMRTRPSFWDTLGFPSVLHAVVLVLDRPQAMNKPAAPLILLSRKSMMPVPDIPLFFGNSNSAITKIFPIGTVPMSPQQVEVLTIFTLKLFADVYSKEFDATAAELPYFLAPSMESQEQALSSQTASLNWDLLTAVAEQKEIKWENQPDGFFGNKFAIDPMSGARKFIIHGINPILKPSDPTPEGVAPNPHRSYYTSDLTIKQYSNSYWKKARERIIWREDQPVLNAELLTVRRNFLDEDFVEKKHPSRCYLIPEAIRISPIPPDVIVMAMMFPSIIHRIDAALIASEACSMLGLSIRPDLALEAFTKDSENTGDHGEEQINFQAGMGNNYERLEYLGDSFLKMATTVSLYTRFNSNSEFENHVERMLLICNKNLFNHAVDRKLPEYIRSKTFDRRTWYPPLKLTKGKAPKTEVKHSLADKTIADVCEALIGAAYLTGDGNLNEAVKAVSCMVKSKNHRQTSFEEYYATYKEPEWQKTNRISAAAQVTVDQVAEAIGYRFKCPAILLSAFKHPSYPYEPKIPDYQRLEWLGDALLDMTVVDYLFKTYPDADPQWLTEHKGAMVSNQFLGCLAIRLGLQKHLLAMNQFTVVAQYVTDLEQAEELERQQAIEESRDPQPSYWVDASHPPKALADIAESVIGAMFVDSKYDYAVIQSFAATHVLPSFKDMTSYDTFATKHPVSMLSHRLQNELGCTRFRFQTATTPCGVEEGVKALTETDVLCALMIHGKVVYSEKGKSGRYVKVRVAKKGLDLLNGVGKDDFSREYDCNCQQLI